MVSISTFQKPSLPQKTPLPSLKRKHSATDSDCVDDSHPKRRRADQDTSFDYTLVAASSSVELNVAQCETETKTPFAQIEKLKSELKEVRERLGRVEREFIQKSNIISRVIEMTHCSICKESIQNPYTLECGHSACRWCLRKWWMTIGTPASFSHDAIVGISTDEESNEETTSDPGRSTHRRRTVSQLVLHSRKQCPECRQIATRRPVPDFRLRDIVDALQPSPLSLTARMKRDEEWSRLRQKDARKAIFPSSADGSAIRSAPTQPAYVILPSVAQGRIETPLPSFFHNARPNGIQQHRTERRLQPYDITHSARRERRRLGPYDPVREACRTTEEQSEPQSYSLPSSLPTEHARVHLNQELFLQPKSSLLPRPFNLSFLDTPPSLDAPLLPPLRSLEHPQEPELSITLEPSFSEPQLSQLQRSAFSSRSRSQPNPQPPLPSFHELLSFLSSSDVTLPPLLSNLPMTLVQTPSHQLSVCLSDGGVESNDGDRRNHGARENQNEEDNNGAATSISSEISGDVQIGADLEN